MSIDQMMAHFGAVQQDVTPPTITDAGFDGQNFIATVLDDYPFPLTIGHINLTLDGVALAPSFDAASGLLTAALGELQGLHHLSLEVRDHFGNLHHVGYTIGELDTAVFSDMEGHWGQDYAEYLSAQGIFSPAEAFYPQQNVTNEMAATLMSRFLGFDTSLYADVVLPYGDVGSISDWALPHVKAMYAEGVMIGTIDQNGIHVFQPSTATTRAQVMTLLGRTIARGYAQTEVQFADEADIAYWAADHIDLLYTMGIVGGYELDGVVSIKPNQTITRAELASILFKLY